MKTFKTQRANEVDFSKPDPEVYFLAAGLLQFNHTQYSCNAIRVVLQNKYSSIVNTSSREYKNWESEHVRQFALAFNNHPWWMRSNTTRNRNGRINALKYMSNLCKLG